MKILSTNVFCVIFIMISALAVSGTIINVPDDQPTIQAGIDASSNGDTVLVQPGTYIENINFNGHNIVLGSLYLTTANESYIATTIIDGDSSGSVITLNSGEDSTCMIIGFTVINGLNHSGGGLYLVNVNNPLIEHNIISFNYAISYSQGCGGGGISCKNSSLTIRNNIIWGNYTKCFGGGIYSENSTVMITNNQICENHMDSTEIGGNGAGIWIDEGCAQILNNTISRNVLFLGGGGGIEIHSSYCSIIKGNLISENSAEMGGGIISTGGAKIENNVITKNEAIIYGGIDCYGCTGIISGNIIDNNKALSLGGGIGFHRNATSRFYNNLIYGNGVTNEDSLGTGGGIHLADCDITFYNNTIVSNYVVNGKGGGLNHVGLGITLYNNIFWGNSAPNYPQLSTYQDPILVLIHCNIQGGYAGEGNIDCDPWFCLPTYYLADSSCCVGAGCDSSGVPNDTINIGALGVGCSTDLYCDYIPGDINGDGNVIGSDVTFGVNFFRGSSSYPPDICWNASIGSWFFSAGDVNGDCSFIGSDITYLVNYFRGSQTEIHWCAETPPIE